MSQILVLVFLSEDSIVFETPPQAKLQQSKLQAWEEGSCGF